MPPSFDLLRATYPYQWNTGSVPPPAIKSIRTDTTNNPTAITKLWLNNLDLISDDIYLVLMSIEVGSTIYIQDHDDHTVFLEVLVTAPPVDLTGYVELSVQYVAHSGTPVGNNQDLLVALFAPAPAVAPPVVPPGGTALIVPPWRQPLACYSILTVPPTEEPITAAEAKLRAGQDWPTTDPRESLMASYIAAARNLVERETGLALLTQTREIYFCPYDPTAPFPLPPQSTPLQSWTVEAWTPGPFPAPVGPARPLLGMMPMSGITGVAQDWTLPAGTTGAKVTVVAGWPSKAALAAEAPTLIHAVGLLVAHMLTLGKDLAITGAVAAISETPQGFEDCIAPHRLMWVA